MISTNIMKVIENFQHTQGEMPNVLTLHPLTYSRLVAELRSTLKEFEPPEGRIYFCGLRVLRSEDLDIGTILTLKGDGKC